MFCQVEVADFGLCQRSHHYQVSMQDGMNHWKHVLVDRSVVLTALSFDRDSSSLPHSTVPCHTIAASHRSEGWPFRRISATKFDLQPFFMGLLVIQAASASELTVVCMIPTSLSAHSFINASFTRREFGIDSSVMKA